MDNIFSKITDYEFFDRLFPGFLVCFYYSSLSNDSFNIAEISTISAIAMIAIMYFVGLTVSRIGSLIIEPLAKKAKLIQYHKGFYLAERNDPKIKVLLKDFNMYRNIAASAIISIVMTLIRAVSLPFDGGELAVRITVLALVFVVYFAAYAKQSVSINNRIKHAKERNLK